MRVPTQSGAESMYIWMNTRSPTSSASSSSRRRLAKLYSPCRGSTLAHSTHVRTVLKPSSLICCRSRRHSSRDAGVSSDSIGARALPPLYQTANGKKPGSWTGLRFSCARELTAGAVLIRQRRLGDRVVVLHLTLGEGGNPRLSPSAYGAQKRAEALAVAEILGAEVIFGPYADGQLPDDEAARRYVSDVIRQVRPTHVITHWKHSFHKDHAAAHAITVDAVLLASLEGVASDYPRHRGVRGILFAENWEDMDGFQPYLHVGVSEEDVATWRRAVTRYEFVGGAISTFRYLDYYDALFTVRGALTRRDRAVAFDIDPFGKRQVLDHLR
jgi:N-acetylglucosamine malate deacetylase 1